MKARACSVGDLQDNDMVAFEVEGKPVLIAQVSGKFYATSDMCTHARASLAEGHLDTDDCTVECPLHGAVFSLKSGEALEFPAEEAVACFPVTVEGDDIYIELPSA